MLQQLYMFCYNYAQHNTTHMEGKQLNIRNKYKYLQETKRVCPRPLYTHACRKQLHRICEKLKL